MLVYHSPQTDKSGNIGVRNVLVLRHERQLNYTSLLLQRVTIIIVHCLDAIRSFTATVLDTSSMKDYQSKIDFFLSRNLIALNWLTILYNEIFYDIHIFEGPD